MTLHHLVLTEPLPDGTTTLTLRAPLPAEIAKVQELVLTKPALKGMTMLVAFLSRHDSVQIACMSAADFQTSGEVCERLIKGTTRRMQEAGGGNASA